MRTEIVLFGAGVYAKKYKAILDYLELEFDYFTDNDSHKWGTEFYGKPVIAPDELCRLECRIIISCTHEDAIRGQLREMGLESRIIELNDLYFLFMQKKVEKKEESVIIDMYEGIGWGGSEIWAAELAYGLQQYGKCVYLLGSQEQPPLEEKYERMTIRISSHNTIDKMTNFIEQKMPCIFINNFAGSAFLAASVVKRKHPDQLKIISVIHGDKKNLMDAHMMMKDYIDDIFCVSNQIKETIQKEYDFDKKRIFYKEQAIRIDGKCLRENKQNAALRIGYAARLVKQAKRVDLLPDLIRSLEKRKVNYIFQIAGWGECADDLADFINENNLGHKVKLFGRIPKSEMGSFWRMQDVIVNLSEYEGSSLSMLEAMAYGCVPVVTDVSGVREFVEHGKNGYICKVGDLENMAAYINDLSVNLDKLEVFSKICSKIIEDRCNPEKYIEYWVKTLLHGR